MVSVALVSQKVHIARRCVTTSIDIQHRTSKAVRLVNMGSHCGGSVLEVANVLLTNSHRLPCHFPWEAQNRHPGLHPEMLLELHPGFRGVRLRLHQVRPELPPGWLPASHLDPCWYPPPHAKNGNRSWGMELRLRNTGKSACLGVAWAGYHAPFPPPATAATKGTNACNNAAAAGFPPPSAPLPLPPAISKAGARPARAPRAPPSPPLSKPFPKPFPLNLKETVTGVVRLCGTLPFTCSTIHFASSAVFISTTAAAAVFARSNREHPSVLPRCHTARRWTCKKVVGAIRQGGPVTQEGWTRWATRRRLLHHPGLWTSRSRWAQGNTPRQATGPTDKIPPKHTL